MKHYHVYAVEMLDGKRHHERFSESGQACFSTLLGAQDAAWRGLPEGAAAEVCETTECEDETVNLEWLIRTRMSASGASLISHRLVEGAEIRTRCGEKGTQSRFLLITPDGAEGLAPPRGGMKCSKCEAMKCAATGSQSATEN